MLRCPSKLVKSMENTCELVHLNENYTPDICSNCKKIIPFTVFFKGILISSCILWFLKFLEAGISRKLF